MLSSTATVQAIAPSFPSKAVEAPVRQQRTPEINLQSISLAAYGDFQSPPETWLRPFPLCRLLSACFLSHSPSRNPATFQRGSNAVGLTRFSARISSNLRRCVFSWSHICCSPRWKTLRTGTSTHTLNTLQPLSFHKLPHLVTIHKYNGNKKLFFQPMCVFIAKFCSLDNANWSEGNL